MHTKKVALWSQSGQHAWPGKQCGRGWMGEHVSCLLPPHPRGNCKLCVHARQPVRVGAHYSQEPGRIAPVTRHSVGLLLVKDSRELLLHLLQRTRNDAVQ